jgi:chromate transporter
MIADIAYLFVVSLLISAATFGGGSQALFYQYGVLQTHWITRTDLSAVLAFGYATPGPAVFGAATFVGYRIGGFAGAVVGTVGIFLVPFVTALVVSRYLNHLLQNPLAEMFVKGVGLAAAGLVAATAFGVVQVHTITIWQFTIAIGSLLVSIRWKVNPLYVLVVGGIIGIIK